MAHFKLITQRRPARAQYDDINAILFIVQTLLGFPGQVLDIIDRFQNFQKSPAPPQS